MSEKNMGPKPKLEVDGDSVDEESFMSTSSNLEPFASDDLGEGSWPASQSSFANPIIREPMRADLLLPNLCLIIAAELYAFISLPILSSFISDVFHSFCAALLSCLLPLPRCAGNTVIHLDKALARMREYERMKLKAEFNPLIN